MKPGWSCERGALAGKLSSWRQTCAGAGVGCGQQGFSSVVRCLFPPGLEWKHGPGRKLEGRRRLTGTAVHQLRSRLTSRLWVGASPSWSLPNSDWDPGLQPGYILVVFLLSLKTTLSYLRHLFNFPLPWNLTCEIMAQNGRGVCGWEREWGQPACSASAPGPAEHQQDDWLLPYRRWEDMEPARQLQPAAMEELVPEYSLKLSCYSAFSSSALSSVHCKLPGNVFSCYWRKRILVLSTGFSKHRLSFSCY